MLPLDDRRSEVWLDLEKQLGRGELQVHEILASGPSYRNVSAV